MNVKRPATGPDCLQCLGEAQAFGGNPPHWAEAMAVRPPGDLAFLDRATLVSRRCAAGLAADADAPLLAAATAVAADPALAQLAWYLHWRVFIVPEQGIPWGAPTLEPRLGALAGAFYLLLSLEFPVRLAALHRQRGYPPGVSAETSQQIASYDGNHRRGRGCPGMYESQFPWLATYFTDPYVRLGRFEFQLHGYGGGVTAWRRPRDGAVLALAEDGTRVDAEGLRLRHDAPPAEGWTTHLAEDQAAVTGNPVAPGGQILQSTVRLDRREWVSCLRQGDIVLDLHIPAGGGMDWDSCVDSFRRAFEFFAQHHPAQAFAAVVVSTWFMDPRLAELLPATANPLRLQRATYLYPTHPEPGGLWFVFLRPMATADPATLPRDTSLRRALAAFLDTGRKWHGGGMFLLREDMREPGDGLYRRKFPALCRELGLVPP